MQSPEERAQPVEHAHVPLPDAPSSHVPWFEQGVDEPPGHSVLQLLVAYPEEHTHVPSLCAVPEFEHVVASEYWHVLPAYPLLHEQEPPPAVPCPLQTVLQSEPPYIVLQWQLPSFCAVPFPLQVAAFEYWHELPAYPLLHEQEP